MSVRVPDRRDARGARYDSAHPIVVSVALFALALAFRVLFWVAFGQGEQAYSAFYKGDAGLWVAYARALADGAPFELGLPLRPPGMAYLLAALGVTGDTFGWQRLAFCALGALVPPLFYLGIRHGVGEVVARWAAGFTCAATGLILLSSSLNNETPYLVLVTPGEAPCKVQG